MDRAKSDARGKLDAWQAGKRRAKAS
jgi:hypothetical protein